ncbi:hypothetical protein V6N13_009466 [Hibiscus sabdariffa]|uniref:Uncharacterized protein n=1 Tax=Hibiscus sabdariffa TaxID=183260 RepID=A0ABR2PP07_9ROSI
MSPSKRKITKDPLATNNKVEKCKAVWDHKTTEYFLHESLDQVSKRLGSNDNDEEDGYRPSPIDLDMEEGSGDSEYASLGATNEFTGINLNSSQGTVNQNSEGKRRKLVKVKS